MRLLNDNGLNVVLAFRENVSTYIRSFFHDQYFLSTLFEFMGAG